MSGGFKSSYFSELAKLEAANFWFHARNKAILWAMCRYGCAQGTFLEIGCGTGFVLVAISKRFPAATLFGSEYFEEGLVFARQRVPRASFLQMDARNIQYKSEFDAIGAFDVLEHIKEDEVVLQQLFLALKPGGLLFITVPQHQWLWSEVDEYACHVRRYDADDLHQKVKRAGFTIKRSTSFVCLLLPAMYLSRLRKKKMVTGKLDEMAELRINKIVNKVFELILSIELAIVRAGVSFPFGGSRLLVAQKSIFERLEN